MDNKGNVQCADNQNIVNEKLRCHGSIVVEKCGKICIFFILFIVANFSDVLTAIDATEKEEALKTAPENLKLKLNDLKNLIKQKEQDGN